MRISRENLLMGIAELVAQRSTCLRKKVGAVIVKDGRVLSMGYAGSPRGLPHCTDAGCLIDPVLGGCIRTIHAETNAIAFAAKEGISLEGATMYVTCSPCLNCAKLIINSGIISVFYLEKYRNTEGLDLLSEARIPHAQF